MAEPDVIENLFGEEEGGTLLGKLEEEITWHAVHHKGGEVPCLMCIQGHIEKGEDNGGVLVPVYRHPMDDEPVLVEFTPTVTLIRKRIEQVLELDYEFNHVLIQKYRNGKDFIGEHSDKTIDVQKGTVITNCSLGSQRTMTLKGKTRDENHRYLKLKYAMPHDSLFVLSLDQNKRFKHAVQVSQQSGVRVSLTFRRIAMFFCTRRKRLVGQGAPARTSCHDFETEKTILIKAFSEENSNPEFDWERYYGNGSPAYFVDYVERYKHL